MNKYTPENFKIEFINDEDMTACIYLGQGDYLHIKWSLDCHKDEFVLEDITSIERGQDPEFEITGVEWEITDEDEAELTPKIKEFIEHSDFHAYVNTEPIIRRFFRRDPMDYND